MYYLSAGAWRHAPVARPVHTATTAVHRHSRIASAPPAAIDDEDDDDDENDRALWPAGVSGIASVLRLLFFWLFPQARREAATRARPTATRVRWRDVRRPAVRLNLEYWTKGTCNKNLSATSYVASNSNSMRIGESAGRHEVTHSHTHHGWRIISRRIQGILLRISEKFPN